MLHGRHISKVLRRRTAVGALRHTLTPAQQQARAGGTLSLEIDEGSTPANGKSM